MPSSINRNMEPPVFAAAAADVFDVEFDPAVRKIEVYSPGDLVVEDINGLQRTFTFPTTDLTGTTETVFVYPVCIEMQVRQILSAGTTVTEADVFVYQ